MKNKKEKIFIHGIANLVIICVLVVFVAITFIVPSTAVFGRSNNSPIYHGNQKSNKVSLMINVYWGTEYLNDILKTLNDYGITTTFFVGGQWVEKEQDYLIKIKNMGHEIGNHGYFHKDHNKLSYDQNVDEIKTCHTIVKQVANVDMNLFAPPSGYYNKSTLEVAQSLGYKTIMWSRDTIDWRDKDSDIVYKRAINVKGGDLVLMHPTPHTSQALPSILDYYQQHNIVATTVSNVLL